MAKYFSPWGTEIFFWKLEVRGTLFVFILRQDSLLNSHLLIFLYRDSCGSTRLILRWYISKFRGPKKLNKFENVVEVLPFKTTYRTFSYVVHLLLENYYSQACKLKRFTNHRFVISLFMARYLPLGMQKNYSLEVHMFLLFIFRYDSLLNSHLLIIYECLCRGNRNST